MSIPNEVKTSSSTCFPVHNVTREENGGRRALVNYSPIESSLVTNSNFKSIGEKIEGAYATSKLLDEITRSLESQNCAVEGQVGNLK